MEVLLVKDSADDLMARTPQECCFTNELRKGGKIDAQTHLVRRRRRWLFAFAGTARSLFDITAIAQCWTSTSCSGALQQKSPQAEVRKGEGRSIASHFDSSFSSFSFFSFVVFLCLFFVFCTEKSKYFTRMTMSLCLNCHSYWPPFIHATTRLLTPFNTTQNVDFLLLLPLILRN